MCARLRSVGSLKDCVQNDGRLYLVFEFVDRDLKKYIDQVSTIAESEVKVRRAPRPTTLEATS
jgi:hypothetical protein